MWVKLFLIKCISILLLFTMMCKKLYFFCRRAVFSLLIIVFLSNTFATVCEVIFT